MASVNTGSSRARASFRTGPPPSSLVSADDKRQLFTTFFGESKMTSADIDPYAERNESTWNLPVSFQGKSENLGHTLELLQFTGDNWPTRIGCPIRKTDKAMVEWSSTEFNPKLTSVTPHRGRVRLLSAKSRSGSAHLIRRGIGIELEHGFMLSEMGQTYFAAYIEQMNQSITETNNYGVIYAYLTCHRADNEESKLRENYSPAQARKIRERELKLFAIFQQVDRPVQDLDSFVNEEIKLAGGKANMWVFHEKISEYTSQIPEAYMEYWRAGSLAPSMVYNGVNAFYSLPGMAGTRIYTTTGFDLGDSDGPVDLLRRPMEYGEYYLAHDLHRNKWGPNYETKFRHIRAYDEPNNCFHEFTVRDMILNCNRFDKQTGLPYSVEDPDVARGRTSSGYTEKQRNADVFRTEGNNRDYIDVRYFGQVRNSYLEIGDVMGVARTAINAMKGISTDPGSIDEVVRGGMKNIAYLESLEYNKDVDNWFLLLARKNSPKNSQYHTGTLGIPPSHVIKEFVSNSNSSLEIPRLGEDIEQPFFFITNNGTKYLGTESSVGTQDEVRAYISEITGDSPTSIRFAKIDEDNYHVISPTFPSGEVAWNDNTDTIYMFPNRTVKGKFLLPPGFNSFAGFQTIADAYNATRDRFSAVYGFDTKAAKEVSDFVDFFKRVSSHLATFFPNSITNSPAYASSWWHSPTPAHTLFESLLSTHSLPIFLLSEGLEDLDYFAPGKRNVAVTRDANLDTRFSDRSELSLSKIGTKLGDSVSDGAFLWGAAMFINFIDIVSTPLRGEENLTIAQQASLRQAIIEFNEYTDGAQKVLVNPEREADVNDLIGKIVEYSEALTPYINTIDAELPSRPVWMFMLYDTAMAMDKNNRFRNLPVTPTNENYGKIQSGSKKINDVIDELAKQPNVYTMFKYVVLNTATTSSSSSGNGGQFSYPTGPNGYPTNSGPSPYYPSFTGTSPIAPPSSSSTADKSAAIRRILNVSSASFASIESEISGETVPVNSVTSPLASISVELDAPIKDLATNPNLESLLSFKNGSKGNPFILADQPAFTQRRFTAKDASGKTASYFDPNNLPEEANGETLTLTDSANHLTRILSLSVPVPAWKSTTSRDPLTGVELGEYKDVYDSISRYLHNYRAQPELLDTITSITSTPQQALRAAKALVAIEYQRAAILSLIESVNLFKEDSEFIPASVADLVNRFKQILATIAKSNVRPTDIPTEKNTFNVNRLLQDAIALQQEDSDVFSRSKVGLESEFSRLRRVSEKNSKSLESLLASPDSQDRLNTIFHSRTPSAPAPTASPSQVTVGTGYRYIESRYKRAPIVASPRMYATFVAYLNSPFEPDVTIIPSVLLSDPDIPEQPLAILDAESLSRANNSSHPHSGIRLRTRDQIENSLSFIEDSSVVRNIRSLRERTTTGSTLFKPVSANLYDPKDPLRTILYPGQSYASADAVEDLFTNRRLKFNQYRNINDDQIQGAISELDRGRVGDPVRNAQSRNVSRQEDLGRSLFDDTEAVGNEMRALVETGYSTMSEKAVMTDLRFDLEINPHFRQRFEEINRKSGNQLERLVAKTFVCAPITEQTLLAMAEFNIVVPFTWHIAKPHICHYMLTAIKAQAGTETGITYTGNSVYTWGDDANTQYYMGAYTYYARTVIHNPKNVFIATAVYCDGYIRGNGSEPFIRGETTYRPESGIYGNGSVFYFLGPYTENNALRDWDITGRYRLMGANSLENEIGAPLHRSFIPFYSEFFSFLQRQQEPIGDEAANMYMSGSNATNTVVFKGCTQYYHPPEQAFVAETPGMGHWKSGFTYIGCDRLRSGERVKPTPVKYDGRVVH